MQGSLRVATIGGIAIRVHYTWLLAFLLIAWSLASSYYPQSFPGWDPGSYWGLGALSALLLFVSVLLHELSHSFVALARGLHVEGITLFIFGGVSTITSEAQEPRDEFLIAVVGPLTSLAISGLCFGALQVAGGLPPQGVAVLGYLGFVNLLLGLFNLLPGFPLDGGRVLRAVLWTATRSLRRATVWASYVGQLVAFVMIGLGVLQVFAGQLVNGLWIAFIGWFLDHGAQASRQQLLLRERLSGITVADVMERQPRTVAPDLPLVELVDLLLLESVRAAPVLSDGKLVGLATTSDVRKAPRERWASLRVADVMTPREQLALVGMGTSLAEALERLVQDDRNQLPVVDGERLVGLLSRAHLMRFLEVRDELGVDRSPHLPRPGML